MGFFDEAAPRKPQAPLAATLATIGRKYKALAPYMEQSAIVQSPRAPGETRGLEFYPPYESESPRPGKIAFELFGKMGPQQKENAVAADALHHLGGYADEQGTTPVDPAWLKMKNEVMSFRSDPQRRVDQEAFNEGHAPNDTMDSWLQRSRADAYVRAGIFPEQNPEWQRALPGDSDAFTPLQRDTFKRMSNYLRVGATEPPPFEPDARAQAMARGLGKR